MDELYCEHCGEPAPSSGTARSNAAPSSAAPSSAHERCRERLAMEPPRYCAACGRRMKVQVTPLGWSAACSRHGSRTS
ncbi:hypothetical protein SPF06_13910 [Sinomonas sp. JGH33]|uniref:Biotin synthase auxiliary protein n=1 Tax=Sinomonas terricola TaxID=3110330 RepID=A0ABU5T9P4_9MICC|nr:hypothetical protein [Sinomonas sp. JGH33]MEA5455826.1 hypothetical protein [Sinomonas sp. JGH33]